MTKMIDDIDILTNNVKGIHCKNKRHKIIQYFKSKIKSNGFLFLQETHSTVRDEIEWKNDFKGEMFFSHGKSNSCGVLICYLGNKDIKIKNKLCDKEGRILILSISIDNQDLVLVNFYNSNLESEQLNKIQELNTMLKDLNVSQNDRIILGGDFNLFFSSKIESAGGNPVFKKKSVSKLIELLKSYDLVDIWRIRNPKTKRYTFRQNHFSGFLQRRLDYIFVSNSLQESTKNVDILAALSSDHSPVFLNLTKCENIQKGNGFWKFNNSLLFHEEFKIMLKDHISNTIMLLETETTINFRSKWEFLKYEIRKFSMKYSKTLKKNETIRKNLLEANLKDFETKLTNDENISLYNNFKKELEEIYDKIVEGNKVRSRCQWYEEGEKSNKFFLNLEKARASQGLIRKVVNDEGEVNDPSLILDEIKKYFSSLFEKTVQKSDNAIKNYIEKSQGPKLTEAQMNDCDKELLEKEIFDALKNMQNNKSPGNDGLTKEFFECFWDDLKKPFIDCIKEAKLEQELSVSQRQAIIKLIEKKGKDKRFIKNWRPISLLNIDYKIISKVFSNRLKNVIPSLISFEQTAYVQNRTISEGGRLISDIIEITDILEIDGFLVTMDIEKAFDSLDHSFLVSTLKLYGFGSYFIDWIKILLRKQESCVVNGGVSTKYFELKRGARQGDPISAFLFILSIEVLFRMIKSNTNIDGIEVFNHHFLYSAYADDATFFLKNEKSIYQLIKEFNNFSTFSGLKPNINKCEISGIGSMKGVQVAVCNMKCVDLKSEVIKILGVYFSYDIKLKNEMNFLKCISSIQDVLKLWRFRNLTVEGKIVVFKTLAISKLVFLAQLCVVPNDIISELEKIQKSFLWSNRSPKIKHETICKDYRLGGLKNIDIKSKVISLQCAWVKKLYDRNFHEWKIIPLFLIHKKFGKLFKFHSNFDFKKSLIDCFPIFYRNIFKFWKKSFCELPTVPSCIFNQFLWFNNHIQIDNSFIVTFLIMV